MKVFLLGCLILLSINSSFAETLVVSFDHDLALQAEEAVDLRQEQQASLEDVNLYDEYVYDDESSNRENTNFDSIESYTN